jgi:hypothetical protein
VHDISSAAKLLESSAITAKEGQEILKNTMERQINTMAHTREELETAWQSITDNAGNLVGQIRQALQDLTTVVGENLVQALDSFDGKVAEVVERFSGTLFETNQTISDIPSLVLNMNETIITIKDAISEQRDIVNGMKETSEQVISDNLRIAADATQHLGESTARIASSTDGMRQFLEELAKSMEAKTGQFKTFNQLAIADFKGIINDLVVEFRQTQSLFDINGSLISVLKRLEGYNSGNSEASDDNRLAQVLSEPLKDLSQQLADLQTAVSKINGDGSGMQADVCLYDRVAAIDQRIEMLPRGFNAVVSQLNNLNKLVAKFDAELENKQSPSKDQTSTESRWWPFGRSAKK